MKKIYSLLLTILCLLCAVSARADEGLKPADEVASWAYDQMLIWAPPGRFDNEAYAKVYPEAHEDTDDAKARFKEIVGDAMAVVYDPSEPPLFASRKWVNGKLETSDDPIGRARTLAVLLAVADSESGGYRRDVDRNLGKKARGDSGRSWCVMQVQLSAPKADGTTSTRIELKGDQYGYAYSKDRGFGGEDLIADRKNCFRVALHMARESFRACRHLPVEERLSMYAGGDCDSGRVASSIRVGKAIRWLAKVAPPRTDAEVMGSGEEGKLAAVR